MPDTFYIYLFIGIAALIIFAIFIGYLLILTRLKRMAAKIDASISALDVSMMKRFDLLNQMVGVSRNYAQNLSIAKDLISLLGKPSLAATIGEKSRFTQAVSRAIRQFSDMVATNPELQADTRLTNLQMAATEVEENLQASSQFYNRNVRIYNRQVTTFPSKIIAKAHHFLPRAQLELSEEPIVSEE